MYRSGVVMAWNVFKFCTALRGLGSIMILLVLGVVGVSYYAVVITNYGPALAAGGVDTLQALAVLILFHCLALDKSASVPPLDETLRKITEPDHELLYQNRAVIDEFRRSFELKEHPKLKKSSQRLLTEKPYGSNNEVEGVSAHGQGMDAIEYTSEVKVEKIGNSNPVQDFEAMLSRRDGPQWVNRAILNMKNKIFDLVENSFKGDSYQIALECLVSLRRGCILEQEPKQFNDFLRHLVKFCQEKDLKSFAEFLAVHEVFPISNTEATESDVSESEARSLMVKKKEPKTELGI